MLAIQGPRTIREESGRGQVSPFTLTKGGNPRGSCRTLYLGDPDKQCQQARAQPERSRSRPSGGTSAGRARPTPLRLRLRSQSARLVAGLSFTDSRTLRSSWRRACALELIAPSSVAAPCGPYDLSPSAPDAYAGRRLALRRGRVESAGKVVHGPGFAPRAARRPGSPWRLAPCARPNPARFRAPRIRAAQVCEGLCGVMVTR